MPTGTGMRRLEVGSLCMFITWGREEGEQEQEEETQEEEKDEEQEQEEKEEEVSLWMFI